MGLGGQAEPIRGGEKEPAARSEDAMTFEQRRPLVGHMLDHVPRDDPGERPVGERQLFGAAADQRDVG